MRSYSLVVLCIRTLLAPANQRKLSFDVRKDIPKSLYPDLAREAFRLRNLSLLQALVNNWPQSTFSLSALLQTAYTNFNSVILPHAEDEEDRLYISAVWKALLDAYFSIVEDYTENSAYPNVCPPPTVFDLSGDTVIGFMDEIEFRGLCKRVLKVFDTCILARTHCKIKSLTGETTKTPQSSPTLVTANIDNIWNSDIVFDHITEAQSPCRLSSEDSPNNDFEIGMWGPTCAETREAPPTEPSSNHRSAPVNVKPVEIPRFVVIVDATLSERSCDLLSRLLQRYEEFPVGLCPVSIRVRHLHININDERKLQALLPLLPTDVVGLFFNDVYVFSTIGEYVTAFLQVNYLDLAYYDFPEEPSIPDTFANSLSQLPHLIHLNLNFNRLESGFDILDNICQGLESFQAFGGDLVTDDLLYLAHSKHSQSLKTLSLSGSNPISEDFPSAFRTLLMATPQLEVLGTCFIGNDQLILALVDTLVGGDNLNVLYSSLRKLYLCCNDLRCETILLLLERLSSLPKLETLALEKPDDLETLNLEGDAGLKTFSKMCTDAWGKMDPVKPELKLVWLL